MFAWLKTSITQIIDWFAKIFTTVFEFFKDNIKAVIKWVVETIGEVFKAAWDFLKDAVSWVLEQILDIAISAANALDLSALDGFNGAGSLPAEVVNVMQLLGVGTAIGIITAAIGIRLLLQLIPFTRLGS